MHNDREAIMDERTVRPGTAKPGRALQDIRLRDGAVPGAVRNFDSLVGCRRLVLGKREIVYHHGDPATHLFRVEQGAAMVQQYLEDGRRQLVEIVLAGGFCGIASHETYTATCETLEASVLKSFRKAELERHPELGWQVGQQIEAQLCDLQEHALTLGRMTAQERVSNLLVKFARRHHAARTAWSPNAALNIHLPMTRGEVGDYLGLSLETVCRTLTELQRKKVITIGPHHGDIAVHNLQYLNRLAGSGSSRRAQV